MKIEPEKKRKRVSPVSISDLMEEAKFIWCRNWDNIRSDKSESRDFRENFGVGVNVAHMVWMMMDSRELILNDGRIHYLLWVLSFMKIYCKERMMCHLNHIRDPKTFQKWVWLFIYSIAELEPSVVSNLFFKSNNQIFILSYLFLSIKDSV